MARPVLFFVDALTAPGTRFRVLQYLPKLEKARIAYRLYSMLPEKIQDLSLIRHVVIRNAVRLATRAHQIGLVREGDLVFFQRDLTALPFPWLEKRALRKSRRMIFDMDDAIFLPPFGTPHALGRFGGRLVEEKIQYILSASQAVIAGNDYLAQYARAYCPNTVVIPTPVDTEHYTPPAPAPPPSDRVVIGWMGTASNIPYLINIRAALRQVLGQKRHVELRLVTNLNALPGELKGLGVLRRWRADRELEDLRSFDIGIMPLPDNAWTRGKCAFKLLQYMATAKPVVCSPVGMNRTVVRPGENGFFARSEAEWVERLCELVDDPERRLRLGQVGRALVERSYSVQANFPKWLKVLSQGGESDLALR